ncbi:polyprenyl synthetase family protein [Arthrobacter sp. UM1]|uniref:polyprenyl synthetase family protein n=1 Tax=Arthrobacter sp. UM1 TaxID=2766776 RepID=UPI001CF674C8|nr:polyprenyl synthetase family protein [Arthrobacter sp. UM1]MCB4207714.1 polyprenyl synthetase family protein [Arthrobacter sp. UM1]
MTDSHTQPDPGLSPAFRDRLNRRLAEVCRDRADEARAISPEAAEMVSRIGQLAEGGKRVRAMLAFHAFTACGGSPESGEILELGATIELFQAAALIHDDIIDRSDTRRGRPSVHRSLEALHGDRGWGLDAARFGESAAILTGDLALAMSDERFAALGAAPGSALRTRFDRMKWEVMAGQYLDIVEEVAAAAVGREEAADRAMSVLRFKSAKYTFEHPTALGALLAGADDATAGRFADFALPIGEAFQISDDDLGVFGDPSQTGKPAGDDLLEGKRTVLVAFAMEAADATQRLALENVLGNRAASEEQIGVARDILERTGARRRALDLAHRLAESGQARLSALAESAEIAGSPQRRQAVRELEALAQQVVERTH